MKIIGIIPARYASQRLPAKPLVNICGLPMVVRVWRNVSQSKIMKEVVVATDDERIADVCNQFNVSVIMTPAELPSGTDRIFAAYNAIGENYDIAVNIQGDEPLISAMDIDPMLDRFCKSKADVGTLVTKIKDKSDIIDDAVVKVVVDCNMQAMYFSRSAIPYIRDIDIDKWHNTTTYWKHIGIYAYKIDALRQFTTLLQSKYEKCEKLEQLRLLEYGAKFLCVETNSELISVDTQEDLNKLIEIIS